MKLSISNIAWDAANDEEMYAFLTAHGFSGLEIAPTRVFPERPYDHLAEAKDFAARLEKKYGLAISSIQSIWYGRNESMFGSEAEKQALIDYTKQAVLFAESMGCRNLVFGCPRNRNLPGKEHYPAALDFFRTLGDFALAHGTAIAIEPNPPIYHTNFINTTSEAFQICREIDRAGIKVNVDLGTMIYYEESLDLIRDNLEWVNHIHVSEPMLALIRQREIHREVLRFPYSKWISLEMKNPGELESVRSVIRYFEGCAHAI